MTSPAASTVGPMRLLHISDTHLHAPGAVTYHPEIDSAARLDTVLAAAKEHGPFDAIILTGDICDDGSVVGAEAVRDRLATAYPAVPVVAVPGNHDLTSSVTTVFGPAPATLGGWRVVAGETNGIGRTEGVAGPAAAALDALDPDDTTPILMLQHHPLRSRSEHEWFVLRDAHLLEDGLAKHTAPIVLLTGHTHQAFQLLEGSVHHIGAPSSYYPIEHDGPEWRFADEGTGALVIELTDDAVESVTLVLA